MNRIRVNNVTREGMDDIRVREGTNDVEVRGEMNDVKVRGDGNVVRVKGKGVEVRVGHGSQSYIGVRGDGNGVYASSRRAEVSVSHGNQTPNSQWQSATKESRSHRNLIIGMVSLLGIASVIFWPEIKNLFNTVSPLILARLIKLKEAIISAMPVADVSK
ncbi:MAG: hypothetical protein LBF94_02405 [Puniceicoccales bacterium]|nr:hypothetical protein [Puniceicoccales bacterium]